MSFYILSTSPIIGKEISNAQFILNKVNQLSPTQALGVVASNSALMGCGAKAYTSLNSFKERQDKALEYIKEGLDQDKWVVLGVLDIQTKEYSPVLITPEGIMEGGLFSLPCPLKNQQVLIFSHMPSSPPTIKSSLDMVLVLEEYPFITKYPTDILRISLAERRVFSTESLKQKMEFLSSFYHIPSVNVPLNLHLDGKIWDGSVVFIDTTKQSCFIGRQEEPHLFFTSPLSVEPLSPLAQKIDVLEDIHQLICESIKEYTYSAGFNKVVIALSGGIDSSLVAALAVESLGKEKVLGLLLPGPYSSEHSVKDAEQLCANLQIQYKTINMSTLFLAYQQVLGEDIKQTLSLENLQARIRGTILMAYANEQQALALNTCNKSEDLVGYSTLYGDAVGALAPLGDLYKREVYDLAYYVNKKEGWDIIPLSSLQKEPSAELRSGQKDTDSLPKYEVLDFLLYSYLENAKDPFLVGKRWGLSIAQIKSVLQKIFTAEYKRAQSPLIIMIGEPVFKGLSQSQIWDHKEFI